MSLRDIVDVQITRETTAVSRVGFGTLLVIGEHAVFGERIRFYQSTDAALTDGFDASDPEYKALAAAFSQQPRPRQVAIGRKTAEEDWTDALVAIAAENNDWYGLAITDRDEAAVLEVAAWVETQRKLFGTATQDAETLEVTTGDIGAQLAALNYARTFTMYHPDANNVFPEAAWFGKQLPTDPGSTTWKFKSLAGVVATQLTATQRTNADNKNVNTYEPIGGVDITREGVVAEREFIDVIRGVDWLEARMTERIYSRLVNLPKIPYTDAGVQVIEAEIRAQLEQAVARQVIAPPDIDTGADAFTISVPRVSTIPFNDRAMRRLPDVTFRATLAGAIHSIEIRGTVTV